MTKTLVATSIATAIGNLHTVASISTRFNISDQTIRELTASGIMPHYRVRGFDDPLFKAAEAREWIANNLIKKYGGTELPATEIVVISDSETKEACNVPHALSAVMGLREFRPDIFCGVYFLCLRGQVIYVGQSNNVVVRASSHKQDKKFDRVLFLRVPLSALDEIEQKFIELLRPPLNVMHKPVEVSS